MPWKSAGVGAGGDVEIEPQAEAARQTTALAAIDRMDGTGGRLAPGLETRSRGYDDRPSEAPVTAANRGRRIVWWPAVLGAALAVGLVTTSAAAETSPPLSSLETPMADLVVLQPLAPDQADPATPMLLVLDATGPAPNQARLSVLERTHAWVPVFTVDLDLERDDLTDRWLVASSARHLALIATTPTDAAGTGHAVIIGFDVRDEIGSPTIVETARTRFDRAVVAAGATDVDGFGTAELAVGLRPALDPSGSCGTTSLQVLDGVALQVRRSIDLPGRLGRGVLGEWDDMRGEDLLVYASPDCPSGGPGGARLVAVRLADGTISTVTEEASGQDPMAYPPPLRVRLDGMTHDHAVVALAEGIAIVDAQGGDPVTIGGASGAPLVAGPDPDAKGPATRIAWIDGSGLHAERIRKDAGGRIVGSDRTDIVADSIDVTRWRLLVRATVGDLLAHGLSSAWLGDVLGEGCPDLVLPGAILPCGSTDLRPGAAWLATRPIAAMPIEGRRGILIAAGLGWDPDSGLPATPAPWAAGPGGWWRPGPSTPFAVSEVRANDVAYFQDFPSPQATIEATTARDGTTVLPGFTGTRMFVSVTPLADGADGPDVAPGRLEGLTTGAGPNGIVTVVRVPVPAGNESGRDGSYTTLSLGDVRRPGAGQTTRWALQLVPINDWGEAGFAVVRTITRDAVGPTLNLEAPFTSPVWPFQAQLQGRAEPGSSVSLEGAGEIPVDDRGRFTVVTHLAPWPQTLRLTATDATGNASIAEFSVVGGVDYRRFPWALIAALSLLAIVAGRGLAAAGRTRSGAVEATRWSTGTLDEGSTPEIEELPPGSGLAPR
jgi:hypothetical protein